MLEPQRTTDPRSPVQPDRLGVRPYIVLAVLAGLALWSLSDVWVDALSPPYEEPGGQDAAGPEEYEAAPGASARGNLGGIIRGDDYPMEALLREEQGTVGAVLTIDKTGRVSNCTIGSSSGSASLDRATCKILTERAKFSPALDAQGQPVASSFSQRITWRLQ